MPVEKAPATLPATPTRAPSAGILTAECDTPLGKLRRGTVVDVVAAHGAAFQVKVWSGHSGAPAEIPASSFRAEPALAMKDDTPAARDDYFYEEYSSPLWGEGGPRADDVGQGYLSDCYFNAAMGAVASANPKLIESLFSPQTAGAAQYAITIHGVGADGKAVPRTITVDTLLPTYRKESGALVPAYSGNNSDFADHKAPLWPSLLEKAYAASMRGGYAKVGAGGVATVAMQALTGVESHDEDDVIKKDGDTILALFRQLQASGAAVTCGTISGVALSGQGGFGGQGDGPFTASLGDGNGGSAELVKSTLAIQDKKGKAPGARDDGNGDLIGRGVHEGKVRYGTGSVEVHYEAGHGPAAAADLAADYQWTGNIARDLTLYGDHEYIFVKLEGDNLVFKNPWGEDHPSPIPIARFKQLFDQMCSNQTDPGVKR